MSRQLGGQCPCEIIQACAGVPHMSIMERGVMSIMEQGGMSTGIWETSTELEIQQLAAHCQALRECALQEIVRGRVMGRVRYVVLHELDPGIELS